MKENQSVKEGEEIAKDLMSKLGVKEADLVKGAYIDLLSEQKVYTKDTAREQLLVSLIAEGLNESTDDDEEYNEDV